MHKRASVEKHTKPLDRKSGKRGARGSKKGLVLSYMPGFEEKACTA
jgi:hypothetical protein